MMRACWNALVAIVYPNLCECCGRSVSYGSFLCTDCSASLIKINAHLKETTAYFASKQLLDTSLFEQGASLFAFDQGTVQQIIHQLKYAKNRSIGYGMGKMLATNYQGGEFYESIDALIPLPIHATRKRKRGYNQAELLCVPIEKMTHIPMQTQIIYRSKKTQAQATFKLKEQRMQNVKSAFSLTPNAHTMKNKHLLIVDDVLTTGSTLSECAKTLKTIEGVRCSFLTFAMTMT